MTIGGFIFLIIILAIIAPEIIILPLIFIGLAGYGILEFILRLFGKSFDGDGPEIKFKGKTFGGKKDEKTD